MGIPASPEDGPLSRCEVLQDGAQEDDDPGDEQGDDRDLDEFDALPPRERLARTVAWLRDEYRYCFWCKFGYARREMEGCPGLTEEEHD